MNETVALFRAAIEMRSFYKIEPAVRTQDRIVRRPGRNAVKIMERNAERYGKLLFDTENNVTQMVQIVFIRKTASEYRISRVVIRPGQAACAAHAPIN